jgi:hypothetical protein
MARARPVLVAVLLLCLPPAGAQAPEGAAPPAGQLSLDQDLFSPAAAPADASSGARPLAAGTPPAERVRSWLGASTGIAVLVAAVLVLIGLARLTAETRRQTTEAQRRLDEQQADASFERALSRYGAGNPPIRAGAALEMARLGHERPRLLPVVLRQLGSAVLLEADAEVLSAAREALFELAAHHPREAIAEFYQLNLRAKRRFVERLAQRAARVGARSTAGLSRYDDFWRAVSAAAGYAPNVLRSLLREPGFETLLAHEAHLVPHGAKAEGRAEHDRAVEELAGPAASLRTTAELLARAMAGCRESGLSLREAWLADTIVSSGDDGADLSGVDLGGAYLQGADLQRVDAQGTSFAGTRLESARLSGADLSGADFHESVLDDAHFGGAKLDGARLWGFLAQPFFDREPRPPSFEGANWWAAELSAPSGQEEAHWDEWLQRNFPRPGTGQPSPTLSTDRASEAVVVRMPHLG